MGIAPRSKIEITKQFLREMDEAKIQRNEALEEEVRRSEQEKEGIRRNIWRLNEFWRERRAAAPEGEGGRGGEEGQDGGQA